MRPEKLQNGSHEPQEDVLQSKLEFGRFGPLKEKPAVLSAGVSTSDSDSYDNELSPSIIHESPNLRNKKGDVMNDNVFFKISRRVSESVLWKDLSLRCRHVYLTLLENSLYHEEIFYDSGVPIKLKPGQYCCSIRELVDLCNRRTRNKDDKVDKSFVERAVSTLSRCSFIGTKIGTRKTIFTILISEHYEKKESPIETSSETNLRQSRDINEDIRSSFVYNLPKETNDNEASNNGAHSFAFRSPPLEKNNEDDFLILQTFAKENGIKVKEKILRRWLKKYSTSEVTHTLKFAKDTMEKKEIKNQEAWIEKALQGRWAVKKENEEINLENAKNFQKSSGWSVMKITEQYTTIEGTGIDLQHSLEPELFKKMLVEKYKNLTRKGENHEV